MITAHRDNSGEGSSANDNASGTGALIELARSYASVGGTTLAQAQPAHTLIFVSTGGAFRRARRGPVRRELALPRTRSQ